MHYGLVSYQFLINLQHIMAKILKQSIGLEQLDLLWGKFSWSWTFLAQALWKNADFSCSKYISLVSITCESQVEIALHRYLLGVITHTTTYISIPRQDNVYADNQNFEIQWSLHFGNLLMILIFASTYDLVDVLLGQKYYQNWRITIRISAVLCLPQHVVPLAPC